MFRIIHSVVNDLPTLFRVTKEVLQDFASENVMYLELRTTPRAFGGNTKLQYVQTVIAAIKEFLTEGSDMQAKLLLSVDRSRSLEDAQETIQLAGKFYVDGKDNPEDRVVVGLDFSGNPTIGSFEKFLDIFSRAREEYQIPISLHFAEVQNDDESEVFFSNRGDSIFLFLEEVEAVRQAQEQDTWAESGVIIVICFFLY
eukprot:TRINITY_DN6582_c0_g1_i18.p1 TRINITY_DN6582_c0_g1~~TRINITY_DN6582_c0_g1_i18.p1  ORF type:complete len:199 (+),score=38.83 TRINITY_DN6582_c0_g1_i18:304-900(+)